MKRLALIITDFRTVLAALVSVAAMFPQTWTWAAELKADAIPVQQTLENVQKSLEQQTRYNEIAADQRRALQLQIELMRETMQALHERRVDER